MGFFTDRERNELNKLPENKLPEGSDRAREVVRPQGADRKAESAPIPDDPVALLQSVTRARVREIDMLITDLQTMRETLQSEASRVQREMAAYAAFSETALQSSRVICESLRAGLRPFQHKRHKEKARSRARRKAARRLARISKTAARFEPVDPEKAVGGSRGRHSHRRVFAKRSPAQSRAPSPSLGSPVAFTATVPNRVIGIT